MAGAGDASLSIDSSFPFCPEEQSTSKARAISEALRRHKRCNALIWGASVVSASILVLLVVLVSTHGKAKPPYTDDVILVTGVGFDSVVFSLSGEAVSCTVPPSPYSYGVDRYPYYGPEYFLHKGDPVYCDEFGRSCHKYCPDSKKWRKLSNIGRFHGTAMAFDDGYFAVTGGFINIGVGVKTSIVWDPEAEKFVAGPDLPGVLVSHCIAAINSTHALMTGGMKEQAIQDTATYLTQEAITKSSYAGSLKYGFDYADHALDQAYMFNRVTGKWTKMESMKIGREGHNCGLVNNSMVVVAAGSSRRGEEYSSEIFDLATETWHKGPSLETSLLWASTLQLEDTFLIAGGNSFTGLFFPNNKIYAYDFQREDWRYRAERLRGTLRDPGLYRLPGAYLDCVYADSEGSG